MLTMKNQVWLEVCVSRVMLWVWCVIGFAVWFVPDRGGALKIPVFSAQISEL